MEIASVTGQRSLEVLARYLHKIEKNSTRPSRRGVGLRR